MRSGWLKIALVAVLIGSAAVWWLRFFPLTRTMEMDPLYMQPFKIFAYQWPLPDSLWWWVPSEDPEHPVRSTLVLFEEGRKLGPARSLHHDIATKGRGRFSHWKNRVIFSASDLTEPRYNKKTYTIEFRPLPRDWVLLASGIASLAVIVLAFLIRLKGRKG